jgi:hypothetical protein
VFHEHFPSLWQEYRRQLEPDWGVVFTDAATSCHWWQVFSFSPFFLSVPLVAEVPGPYPYSARERLRERERARARERERERARERGARTYQQRGLYICFLVHTQRCPDLPAKRPTPCGFKRSIPMGAFGGAILWSLRGIHSEKSSFRCFYIVNVLEC